jgi:predicted TIM-barrel fold metal-dependent hydrolase
VYNSSSRLSGWAWLPEPVSLWEKLAEAPTYDPARRGWIVDTDFVQVPPSIADAFDREASEAPPALTDWSTANGRLAAQKTAGLGGEVLYPTTALFASLAFTPPETESAALRRYNEWIAEFVATEPGRLVGIGQIPTSGVDRAIEELQWCKEHGLRGVQIRAYPSGAGRPQAEDSPFWEAASDAGLPVSIDDTFGPVIPASPQAPAGASLSRLGTVLTGLVTAKIFDDFPSLLVVVVTPTISWLPYALERADDQHFRFAGFRGDTAHADGALPIDYLRTRVWYTVSDYDPLLFEFPEYVSYARMIWSSGAPSAYSTWPHDGDATEARTEALSEPERLAIMGDNARRLYGQTTLCDEPPLSLIPLSHAVD